MGEVDVAAVKGDQGDELDGNDARVEAPVDGRAARRQRNIDRVLDVVLEMFAEDAMFPSIEQAATRSGLSLRSLYRYFADPAELTEAAIERTESLGRELGRLPAIGEGPVEARIAEFVAMRVRMHERLGPIHRASLANAARHERIRVQRAKSLDEMRRQFELQFAPELAALGAGSTAAVAAGDLLSHISSIDFLRHHRGLSTSDTERVLVDALRKLLVDAAS